LATGELVREIAAGNAPYGVALTKNKAYVSNWAGRHPDGNTTAGESGAGPPVRVDPTRHIASDGSVSVIDLAAGREIKQIVVVLHSSGTSHAPDGRHVLVANANSDTLSVINTSTDEIVE